MASPSIRINLPRQELVLEKSGKILLQCPVSSGKAGTGHEEGSGKTPTGHFRICKKIGDGEPEDTIFISRLPAGRYPTAIPKSLDEHSDFILTRILWLDGLEPHNANTRSRYIYIHGTNDTELLGTPPFSQGHDGSFCSGGRRDGRVHPVLSHSFLDVI